MFESDLLSLRYQAGEARYRLEVERLRDYAHAGRLWQIEDPQPDQLLAACNRQLASTTYQFLYAWLQTNCPGLRGQTCADLPTGQPGWLLGFWLGQLEFHLRCGPLPGEDWAGLTTRLTLALPAQLPLPAWLIFTQMWRTHPRSRALRQQWQLRTGELFVLPAAAEAA